MMEGCSIIWELGLETGNLGSYLKLKLMDKTSCQQWKHEKEGSDTNRTAVWSKKVSTTIYWELSARRDDDGFSYAISHCCSNPEK